MKIFKIRHSFNKAASSGQSLPFCYKSNALCDLQWCCAEDIFWIHTMVKQGLNSILTQRFEDYKLFLEVEVSPQRNVCSVILALSFLSSNVTFSCREGSLNCEPCLVVSIHQV